MKGRFFHRRSTGAAVLALLVALAGLLVYALLYALRHPPADRRASIGRPGAIVLVTIDTLRADRLGAYGSTRGLTPHLDALAADGVRFDAAIAQVPLTRPSHATILTGRHPAAHGVRTNDGFRLPPGVPTLAEALGRAGRATGAFIGGAPLDASSGLARGFDRYDDDFLRVPGSHAVERRADEVVTAALSWLAARSREGRGDRVFVWLHLFDPHSPYDPPPAQARAFPDAPYDGEVAYTDAALGRFFDHLRADGLFETALIVVVADHGESLGEHGERTHGTFLYDATVRVPLIVRLPRGRGAGRVVPAPVETADLAPTIAGLAGATLAAPVDGISLVPMLAGAPGDLERPAYAESYYQNVLLGWSPLRAVRTARWKFIEAPRPELYDLRADPGETVNLAASRQALVRGLAAALPQPRPPGAQVADATPGSREAAERLRSLGYIAGRTASGPAAGVDPKDRVDEWRDLEEGIDLMGRDPEAAERALRRALGRDPRNGLALKYLGDLSYTAGRDAEAAGRYRDALDAGFVHPDVFVNLAEVARRLGRPAEARQALERAVALQAGTAEIWNQLGILRGTSGDPRGAAEAFAHAIRLEPERPEPYYNLALVERAQGREASAMEHLARALALNPGYAEAHLARGDGLLRARRPADALDAYRRALASRPDYPEALFSAAEVEASLGRRADALRDYRRFLDVSPRAFSRQIAIAKRAVAAGR